MLTIWKGDTKMKKEIIGICPICNGELTATVLTCTNCDTSIEGKFYLSKFLKLPKEDLEFIEIFIKNRGNIKSIEKEMNISYPTVRNKLENVIELLGYKKEPITPPNAGTVLERLNNGEITPQQAIDILNGEEPYL